MVMCCAKCGSERIRKDGMSKQKKQRWHCNVCKHRGVAEFDMVRRHPGTMSNYKMTERQREIFVGHILGDGTVTKHGSFKINRSSKDTRYLEWTRKEFIELHPYPLPPSKIQDNYIIESSIRRDIHSSICRLNTLSTIELSQERKIWYPVSNKIVPRDILLSPLSLAIWYLDDGSIYTNNYTISLHTENFVEEDVVFLSEVLIRNFSLVFDMITAKTSTNRNKWYFLRMNGKENMFRFARIVDRYITSEMGMSEDRTSGVNKTPWRSFGRANDEGAEARVVTTW